MTDNIYRTADECRSLLNLVENKLKDFVKKDGIIISGDNSEGRPWTESDVDKLAKKLGYKDAIEMRGDVARNTNKPERYRPRGAFYGTPIKDNPKYAEAYGWAITNSENFSAAAKYFKIPASSLSRWAVANNMPAPVKSGWKRKVRKPDPVNLKKYIEAKRLIENSGKTFCEACDEVDVPLSAFKSWYCRYR